MTELNSVQQFYAGKTVFITGGSGFMGKVLIEKLLYSCTDLKELIVLMRPKKGKSAKQRVEDFESLPLFCRVMKEKPEAMKKISPVYGDLSSPNLGLNEEQLRKVVESSEIVFHFAASLKLEATLRPNILTNLTATKYVLDLAKTMKKLIQMVHLSTAFCCEDQEVLDEKVYDFPHNPYDLMKCAEWMSEGAMAAMQKETLGSQPNTYTYTKRLTELLVRDEFNAGFPVCIIRPSIVSPSYKDPIPGWVDSLNGPPGIFLAAGKGVLRSMLIDPESFMAAIPVDICINGIIVMTKDCATKKSSSIPVFNVSLHESRLVNNGTAFKYARALGELYPCTAGLWYPDGNITQNVWEHKIKVFLFQLIPAYFIDFWLMVFGQKRFMVHVQNRISVGMEVIQFFTMRNWKFNTDNMQNLTKSLTEEEDEMFGFDTTKEQGKDKEWEYMKNSLLGGRQYCVKDPLSTLPKARMQRKIQYAVHIFCKFVFWYFVTKWTLQLFGLYDTVAEGFDFIIGSVTTKASIEA